MNFGGSLYFLFTLNDNILYLEYLHKQKMQCVHNQYHRQCKSQLFQNDIECEDRSYSLSFEAQQRPWTVAKIEKN